MAESQGSDAAHLLLIKKWRGTAARMRQEALKQSKLTSFFFLVRKNHCIRQTIFFKHLIHILLLSECQYKISAVNIVIVLRYGHFRVTGS